MTTTLRLPGPSLSAPFGCPATVFALLVFAAHVGSAVPDFELFTDTDDEDVSRNAGVFEKFIAESDSSLGIFLGNPHVAVEIAAGVIAFLGLRRDRFDDLGRLLKGLLGVK